MTAFECATITWFTTALFGTLIFSLLCLIAIPFIFILFFIALLWSIPQFILTIFTLNWMYKLNIRMRQKIYWITLATFIYSILTAASFHYPSSFLLFFFWTNIDIFTTILFLSPYIGVSAVIMYYEATTFFQQDKIP